MHQIPEAALVSYQPTMASTNARIMKPDEALRQCLTQILTSQNSTHPAVISLPSVRDPQVFLPVDRRISAVRVLARRFGGRSLRRRVETVAVSGAILLGVSTYLPLWRTKLDDSDAFSGLHGWLSETIYEPYRVSLVVIGPRRANRKPVAFIVDAHNELIAVAKFGYNEVTRPLVRHEARALARVASSLVGHVHVPSLIGASRIGDIEVMAMRQLPPLEGKRQVSCAELVSVVRAISASGGPPRSELSSLLGHPRMRPLADMASMIDEASTKAPVGAIHGDFHTGNIGIAQDQRPVVWDWERWSDGVPIGFDLLHYNLQYWIAHEGITPQAAADRLIDTAPSLLAPLQVSPSVATDVARDCLIRLAARYVGDAQDKAGSKLGHVEKWLFPAVLRRSDN